MIDLLGFLREAFACNTSESQQESPPEVPEMDSVTEEDRKVLYPEMRLAKYAIHPGTKRPEVWLASVALAACGYDLSEQGTADDKFIRAVKEFQKAHGLSSDGIIGGGTWPILIGESAREGYVPDLRKRTQTCSCFFENGRRDAYGMAEDDIGDNAGANYGIVQHNARGSMKTLLRLAGRPDLLNIYTGSDKSKVNTRIKAWMGSSAGIKAQDKYFNQRIYKKALRYTEELGFSLSNKTPGSAEQILFERCVALMVDIVIQNGSLYSRTGKPFWRTYTSDDPRGFKYRELYEGTLWDNLFAEYGIPYSRLKSEWWAQCEEKLKTMGKGDSRQSVNKGLMTSYMSELEDGTMKLALAAQWRSRCSSSRWWYRVWQRKGSLALGSGKAQGSKINTAKDFGIGTDYWLKHVVESNDAD